MEIKIDRLDFYKIRIIDENGEYLDIDLKEELQINEHSIDMEMLQQPAKYIYWSSILEKIVMYQESAQFKLEILEAQLDEEARAAILMGGTKPTKDSVDAYVKRKPSYQGQRETCNTYSYLVKNVSRIVKSLEQRKDMLQSFGKMRATEIQYGHKAGRNHEK